jgi:hypothetical protein
MVDAGDACSEDDVTVNITGRIAFTLLEVGCDQVRIRSRTLSIFIHHTFFSMN